MSTLSPAGTAQAVIQRGDLPRLFEALQAEGYTVIGPTVRDGAIVYDELRSCDDLPVGWTDVQEGGAYRLERRSDQALFGYNVGPHSWKKYLFPPSLRLWRAKRNGSGVEIIPEEEKIAKLAFFGVRACELHAMQVQDRVFVGGAYVDPTYALQRGNAFIVAVNCGQAGGTCFCASMNTGPKVDEGYDLALTELLDGGHRFLVEAGSEAGARVLARVPSSPAGPDDVAAADRALANAAEHMGRTLDTTDIKGLLYRNYEHPRWEEVATRCLSCANCTMVCPTCFCSTVEDVTDLSGEEAERVRRWDSCFTVDFSYIHGGSVRATPKSRYRQWMTHKLGAWIDQFGTSGCVGCGRCITWCPVAIDITEEVARIRLTDGAVPAKEGSDGDA